MATDLEPQLFVVYLGGDPLPGRLSEDHEVVVVAAPDIRSARKEARRKWGGQTRPHVDAVKAVTVVDGYRVTLEWTGEADSNDVDVTYEPGDGWADG